MTKEEFLERAIKNRAILEGYFLLSSGLRSEKYFQCAKIFENPLFAMDVCEALKDKILKTEIHFDVILSPAMGGVLVGYELSRQMLKPNMFVERVDNVFTLKRGFELKKGQKILLVEDVVTTGKSSLEAINVVKEFGGEVVLISSIINRSGVENPFVDYGYKFLPMFEMTVETFDQNNIPTHLKDKTPIKPGSRKIL